MRSLSMKIFGVLLGLMVFDAVAQGLPTQTWPAGTLLASWPQGGRIDTFHRGYLYIGGDANGTHIYDISNPQQPALRQSIAAGVNGHVWQKVGDLFYRQYYNPELGLNPPNNASVFLNLTDPLNRVSWTQPIHNFPYLRRLDPGQWMDTYPFWFNTSEIWDARLGRSIANVNVYQLAGLSPRNRFRVGNLLFLTPGDGDTGVAVIDIGNPASPRLLDTLIGNYKQYTTAWQLYEHYLVLMSGDNTNGPDANGNAVLVDFSDPTNLRVDQVLPFNSLPGRYAFFQDHFAFAGRHGRGVKFDMNTRQVVREFLPGNGNPGFGDFQWLPLGHLLLVSGNEATSAQSWMFAHQSGLDVTRPSVGYHVPADGAVRQPLTTVIGLVVHERLEAHTVSDQNIQLFAVGSSTPLPGVVVHTSYDVINFHPVQPLLANTTYELRVNANGVRDIAGNGINAMSFRFSTGDSVVGGGNPPVIASVGHSPTQPATGQNVSFTVSASDPDATPLQYSWNFGDGSPDTAFGPTATQTHAYAQPGSYVAQVQVRDADGQTASGVTTVVVQSAPQGTPKNSASVLVHPTRREIWSVNPDHDTVTVLHADSFARLGEVAVGDYPTSLAVAASGDVWVSNRDSDTLSLIAAATRTVQQTVTLRYGSRPEGLVIHPTANTGYVARGGIGDVLAFDSASGALGNQIALGAHPQALSIAGNGSQLYVSRMISGSSGLVQKIPLPTATTFGTPVDVTLAADSTTPDSGTAARGVPNYVGALALTADGARLWYGAKKDNVFRGRFRENSALSFETTMRAMLGRVDTAAATESPAQRLDIDNASRPSALLLAPGDHLLFVALEGNNQVKAINPATGAIVATADTGRAPHGLALDSATGRLIVRNFLGRNVGVYDAQALIANGSGALTLLQNVAATTPASEPLTEPQLRGKRVFYNAADARMAQEGYFSCAMCHLDGRSDGRVWDFTQLGEGLRNTTSLRGVRGMSHGLVHWSGNFDEIQDFEIPIRRLFGGLGFLDEADFQASAAPLGPAKAGRDADLDALAVYVASLDRFDRSPFRSSTGALTADGSAGRAIFQQLNCQRCHAGDAFTDSATGVRHDVGTLSAASGTRLDEPLIALDTPTLRGLWDGAPYLHDGRAAAVGDVLQAANPNGMHGDIASLGTTQRNQLISFLRQIDGSEPGMPAPASLTLTAPAANAAFTQGQPVALSISTTLPNVTRVDCRIRDQIIATSNAAPWSAQWIAGGFSGRLDVRAHVHHDNGRYNTLSTPATIQVGCSASGTLRYQRYEGLPGTSIASLLNAAVFPNQPTHTSDLASLIEGPVNFGDNYGTRISGWLCAPETGSYRFWVAGDDQTELHLSTDASAANRQRIAFHTSWTASRQWDKFATQQSALIPLQAGQAYYIEVLEKEGDGGDNVAVGWQLPSGALQRPAPTTHFSAQNQPLTPVPSPGLLFANHFE
jgi:YVTN family beta-propeller protein